MENVLGQKEIEDVNNLRLGKQISRLATDMDKEYCWHLKDFGHNVDSVYLW